MTIIKNDECDEWINRKNQTTTTLTATQHKDPDETENPTLGK